MPTLLHVSDLHFGRDVVLAQVRALERLAPDLRPTAIVISGDLTQRARHGEFQAALCFVEALRAVAPTLVVPGNHDVQWWASPFMVFGRRRRYRNYRTYVGEDLSPVLELPGLVVVGARSSHGISAGSMTWRFWRDTAVKGHLQKGDIDRATGLFGNGNDRLNVLVTHHNILRGAISGRMGLAGWRAAHGWIASSGADLVLCGHDHQEAAALLDERVVVSTAGTFTSRTRGRRPSAFNLIRADDRTIAVTHYQWDGTGARFTPGSPLEFPRRPRG